jgi:hypothetical protein
MTAAPLVDREQVEAVLLFVRRFAPDGGHVPVYLLDNLDGFTLATSPHARGQRGTDSRLVAMVSVAWTADALADECEWAARQALADCMHKPQDSRYNVRTTGPEV